MAEPKPADRVLSGGGVKGIEALDTKGYAAAEKFLSTWDWDAYLDRFR